MKRFETIAVLLVFLIAGSTAMAGTKANPIKGKIYFRVYCRVCHDGNGQEIKLGPNLNTMESWGKSFEKEGSSTACIPRAKEKMQKKLSDQDMVNIQAYLIQHAADSDHPAKCGD